MTKYAANAMLAARISLMNEIANLCERGGQPTSRTSAAASASTAASARQFLFPGVGYGGSCFPKDVKALITHAPRTTASTPRMLRAVDDGQRAQKRVLFEKVERALRRRTCAGKRFAVWGLSFKPRTDDMREAPAVTLIEALLAAGAEVHAHDPVALSEARRDLRRPHHLSPTSTYDALRRRRRAAHRHRVERVPPPGLRAHEDADAAAGDLRRPQPLRARRTMRAARLHLLRRSAGRPVRERELSMGRIVDHRRRRLHRLASGGSPARATATRSSRSTTSPPAIRATSLTCSATRAFTSSSYDVTEYIYVDGHGRRDLPPRLAAEPGRLPAASRSRR